jgi:membrane protease YdiL (CAAX protease family)
MSEESDARSEFRPSLLWLFLLVAIVFALNRGVLAGLDRVLPDDDLWAKIGVALHQTLAIIAPVLALVALQPARLRDAVGLFRPVWRRLAAALVAGLVLIVVVNTTLPRLIPPTPTYTARTGSIVAIHSFPELLLAVLAVVVLAPLADELFLRGVVLRGLVVRWGPAVAILVTALLTAAFHTLEPFKLAHAFIMGVVFATAVVWTRSLWASLLLHALHNTLGLLGIG